MLLESAAITTIKQLPRPQSHGVRGKMNYWSAGQEMTTKVNPEPKAMGAVLFLYFQVRFFFFAHFVPVLFARLVVRHYAATALFIEIASGLYLTT